MTHIVVDKHTVINRFRKHTSCVVFPIGLKKNFAANNGDLEEVRVVAVILIEFVENYFVVELANTRISC
jgi:hypothetical protein